MTAADTEPESIGHRAASGVVWLTAQKWVVRLAGLATIAILTRFVSPADFGTVAAATTVLPFFYLLSDLGFSTYVVQADHADRRVLSTGFWFSVGAGAVLTVVLIAGAPLLGLMYGSADVVPVIQALAIAVPLTALSSISTAVLRRSMRFRALAFQALTASLVAQVVAVVMALSGLGVWALVGQTLSSQLVMTVMALVAARWLPSWMFSWSEFVAMTRFGTQVLGVELVAMSRAAAEAAIISHVLGLTVFGYLTIAQKLVQVVQDLTGSALLPVTTVAFAKIRDSSERLLRAYLRALRLTYAVMSPPLILLSVAAPLIIPIVFGDGWEESFTTAQFLAIAGIVVLGAALDHGLFYGLGKPGRWLVYAVVIDALTVAATAVAVQWGIVGVAIGFLIVAVVATASRWFLVARLLRTPARVLTAPFVYLTVTIVASGAVGVGLVQVSDGLPAILRIIIAGLGILVVHALVTAWLARPVFSDLRGYASKLLPSGRRGRRRQEEES
jgi:O-antigen/teichoic acid export membrane protein